MSKAAPLALALWWAAAPAVAQDIGDPTRPTPLRATAPVETVARPQQQWHLQSTLVAAQRRVAIINGRSVREGEMIDGARLVEVRAGGVRLERGGESFELTLRAEAVQRLPPTATGNP